MSAKGSILVGCVGSVAWVRISGAANHHNTGCVRDFLTGCFEKGWRSFVIDLDGNKGIDSTFIGMLYRLACKVDGDEKEGTVDVINPGERNASSIRKLGLDRLINVDGANQRWLVERELVEQNLIQPLPCAPLERTEHTEMVLDAHEALIAANEENRSRFCDVVEFLKRDLGSEEED